MRVYQFRHIRAERQCSRGRRAIVPTIERVKRGLLLAALLAAGAAAPARAEVPPDPVEVVVGLHAPPLARAVATSRVLTSSARRTRLDVRAPMSRGYLRRLEASQRALEGRLAERVPGARVRWRYGVVVNALAVVLPRADVARLRGIAGVARVYPTVRYRARLDRSVPELGAPALWGADLAFAGTGLKIGIVDDGVDQTHPFFAARGFPMPPGYPRGDTAYTSAKVIVARAFPPPGARWRHAGKPFDPEFSEHGTHVAGIAAGNSVTGPNARRLAGVAPRAYIGNYKALTIPTVSGVGLDGNSPELARAIEAAVRDGMDVVNLSLGEPEIEPSRDLVVQALNGAAEAGVVPVVAAGNDYEEFGRGSVSSPGSAERAITVGAATVVRDIASFSSSGPTPISLQLKPDVAAPGASIFSSVPEREGTWNSFSGTSMAAPHVAGAAALLRQRHPEWSPAQVKSALATTGDPLRAAAIATTRQGGGFVNLPRADAPLLFAVPSNVSFGLVRPGQTSSRVVELADAGGGGGTWSVRLDAAPRQVASGTTLAVPETATVPGRLTLSVSAGARAGEGEAWGYVVLSRGADVRRIAYWYRVAVASLAPTRPRLLARTGTYRGNTAGRPARADAYRYPERVPRGTTRLRGPEQVFRVRIGRNVANFGVAVLSRGPRVRVTARTLFDGDEDRQVGYTSLPFNLNPYLPSFGRPRAVSGAVLPAPGSYDIVFDTPSARAAGRFTFRFWINDTTPPRLRLLTPRVSRRGRVVIAVSDRGSGVDPQSVYVGIGNRLTGASVRRGRIVIPAARFGPGRHRLFVQASDLQETRNMENVPLILPNTRQLSATVVVR